VVDPFAQLAEHLLQAFEKALALGVHLRFHFPSSAAGHTNTGGQQQRSAAQGREHASSQGW
jgi:hypothetical protein